MRKLMYSDYLGDAVYASWDGFHIVLTTDHHDPHQASDVIYLEPSVVNAFGDYQKRLAIELKREVEKKEVR